MKFFRSLFAANPVSFGAKYHSELIDSFEKSVRDFGDVMTGGKTQEMRGESVASSLGLGKDDASDLAQQFVEEGHRNGVVIPWDRAYDSAKKKVSIDLLNKGIVQPRLKSGVYNFIRGANTGITLGIAGRQDKDSPYVAAQYLQNPQTKSEVYTNAAGQLAGGFITYSGVANVIGRSLQSAPAIARFAQAKPFLYGATIQNLGEEAVEATVRAGTGQEYNEKDFMLGMILGGGFEGIWAGARHMRSVKHKDVVSQLELIAKENNIKTKDDLFSVIREEKVAGSDMTYGELFNEHRALYFKNKTSATSIEGEKRLAGLYGGDTVQGEKPQALKDWEDIDTHFSKGNVYETNTKKDSFSDTVSKIVTKPRELFATKFAQLDRMEKELYKKAGVKKPSFPMSDKMQLVSGAGGKAEADIMDFREGVTNKIGQKDYDNFNKFLFLKRTKDRLIAEQASGTSRSVGNWTLEKVDSAMMGMQESLGKGVVERFESVGKRYQELMDKSLRQQVTSGRMSMEDYEKIKGLNEFYAPFRNLKKIQDTEVLRASGISSPQEISKSIKGIEEEDFLITDILHESENIIHRSRLLAEKNRAMQEFVPLLKMDTDGKFIKEIKGQDVIPDGWQKIHIFENGKELNVVVAPEIARSVKGLTRAELGIVTNMLRTFSKPFKFGATAGNLSFQTVNMPFADIPRLAVMSRYGIKNPVDLFKFQTDLMSGIYHSFKGEFTGNDEAFKQFLKSGAADSIIQRTMTPEVFDPIAKNSVKKVLSIPAKLAAALESTTKITGLSRGIREVNKKFGVNSKLINESLLDSNKSYRDAISEMVTEVRQFSGSPDFARSGSASAEANIYFMFLNARIQGISADLGRLVGKRGRGTAAAWARLSALMAPVALNAIRNQIAFKEDYDQLPDWEKDSYIHIFRNSHFINEDGQKIRESTRIPKREIVQMSSNIVEGMVDWMLNKDKSAGLSPLVLNFIEQVMPINIDITSDQAGLQRSFQTIVGGMNPMIQIPVEVGTNTELFTGREIVPERAKVGGQTISMQELRDKTQQYRESTPEYIRYLALVNQKMGLPETLQSPLMLENMFDTFTGGLFRSLRPAEQLEGRSTIAHYPIAKRFFRSPYVNNDKAMKAISDFGVGVEDEKMKNARWAEERYNEYQNLQTKEEKDLWKSDMAKKYDDGRVTPEQEKAFEKLIKYESEGLTYAERYLKYKRAGNIENGKYAKFFYEKYLPTVASNEEEAKAILKEYYDKEIIKEKDSEQIIYLIKKNGWPFGDMKQGQQKDKQPK